MSHTERTLAHYRARGYRCAITEKWNSGAGRRQDLFGFIDIIGLHPDRGIVGIQSCGGDSDFRGHVRKLMQDRAHYCVDWLQAGGKIDLLGWRKIGRVYKPRFREFTINDFLDTDFVHPAFM